MRRLGLMWGFVVTAVIAAFALGAGVEDAFDLVTYNVLAVVLATVAVLILRGHPGHRVGLLFGGLSVWLGITEVADAYGIRAQTTDLPAGEAGEWLIAWSWIVELAVWPLVFLLFPAGRLLGPRWRFPAALLIGGGAVASIGYAFTSEEAGENFASGRNPVAIDALPTLLLFDIGIVAVMVGTAAAVAAILIRLRRARGVERQQLKWFAFAASAVLAVVPFAIALWYETFAVQVVMSLALMMLPLATGVAILRYRLYDIDVVIRRTLTYAVLTATLAGAYLACVLLAQLVLPSGSDLTVALSTVAVAAVFNPARRWIQSTVDRRFFRRSYDAQQTLIAFGARVRDQVDLEALSHDLRGAVGDTLQPVHVSVWLREAPR